MADQNSLISGDDGPRDSVRGQAEAEAANQHVLTLLAEIQRLHRITSRDGDIDNKRDFREGHQERSRHHHQLLQRNSNRSRRRNATPQQQEGNNNNNRVASNCSLNRVSFLFGFSIILIICVGTPLLNKLFEHLLGMRCFVPNNYLVWEATRPKSDCSFCSGYDGPLILPNMTREQFAPYAYSSAPIIIKNAVSHWPAVTLLNYTYLKDLYLRTPGALDSVHEDCQFLHFKSNFMSLHQVFEMPRERAEMVAGQQPWYIGWSNCHPGILAELRKLYPRPHFLPSDAEMPNTDFIFLGWEQGAVMHLDYIPRLMWQAQLKGRKHWMLAPTPECETQCKSFSFFVEAGDAVLVDTRLWYHGTHVSKGEFSLTVQSEYG